MQADTHITNKEVEPNGKTEALDKYQPGAVITGEDNNKMDLDGSESSDQDEDDATDREPSGSDDDDKDAPNSNASNGVHLQEHIEFHDGRQRRRAIFGNDVDQNDLMVSFKQLCLFLSHASLIPTGHRKEIRLCYGHSLSVIFLPGICLHRIKLILY